MSGGWVMMLKTCFPPQIADISKFGRNSSSSILHELVLVVLAQIRNRQKLERTRQVIKTFFYFCHITFFRSFFQAQRLREGLQVDVEALRRKTRLLEASQAERFQSEKDKIVQILEAGFAQRERLAVEKCREEMGEKVRKLTIQDTALEFFMAFFMSVL
jgi:hypothetical protein